MLDAAGRHERTIEHGLYEIEARWNAFRKRIGGQ
jgi:hypothetical protein